MGIKPGDFGTKAADQREHSRAFRDDAEIVTLKAMIIEMRKAGMLAPGKKPTARDFERFAAFQTAQSAMLKGAMLTKDLSALEQLGGLGGLVVTVLTDPKSKATQKAFAMQQAGQIYKLAPTLVNGGYAKEGDPENVFVVPDAALDDIARDLGGDE